mmetsp:Transcript_36521/g.91046  ORF Transcript_36521/g.91046 Transcript_36521/m.91046 type:complete len:257 (+) Transcript_36521:2866-3636(+)
MSCSRRAAAFRCFWKPPERLAAAPPAFPPGKLPPKFASTSNSRLMSSRISPSAFRIAWISASSCVLSGSALAPPLWWFPVAALVVVPKKLPYQDVTTVGSSTAGEDAPRSPRARSAPDISCLASIGAICRPSTRGSTQRARMNDERLSSSTPHSRTHLAAASLPTSVPVYRSCTTSVALSSPTKSEWSSGRHRRCQRRASDVGVACDAAVPKPSVLTSTSTAPAAMSCRSTVALSIRRFHSAPAACSVPEAPVCSS